MSIPEIKNSGLNVFALLALTFWFAEQEITRSDHAEREINLNQISVISAAGYDLSIITSDEVLYLIGLIDNSLVEFSQILIVLRYGGIEIVSRCNEMNTIWVHVIRFSENFIALNGNTFDYTRDYKQNNKTCYKNILDIKLIFIWQLIFN